MCVADVVPPTVFLPPLKLLKTCSDKEISYAIASLRYIYLPEVRGSSRRRHEPRSADATHGLHSHLTLGSHRKNEQKESNILSEIRADPFERTFAIQWLTRFISIFSEVVGDSSSFLAVSSQALEEAASLLAICAGSAASGIVTRTFTFPFKSGLSAGSRNLTSTVTGGLNPISVVLRDAPLESSDFSSVGAQTWGGSCILAEMIAEDPQNFSICSREGMEPSSQRPHVNGPFRALELGAGTGLASLVLGKVLERTRDLQNGLQEQGLSETQAVNTVIATDFHPSVLANLKLNFAVNFPSQFNSLTYMDDECTEQTPSQLSNLAPNMIVLPLDWSVVHSLVHPISRPRVDSPFKTPEIEDKDTSQISTPAEDTPDDRHYCAFDADTHFHSQVQTQEMHQTQIICDQRQFSGDNANVQTATGAPQFTPELVDSFDLIIGADIIYEHSHARWVRSCIERFLRKPRNHYGTSDSLRMITHLHPTTALFHLVIPLRHTHAVESHSVELVFSQAKDILLSRQLNQKPTIPSESSDTFGMADHTRGPGHPDENISSSGTFMDLVPLELAIISQEDIRCDAYSDREEDVVYRYYRIGWV